LPGNSAHGSGDASYRASGGPPRSFSSTNYRPRKRSYRRHR
jgi:hypothetical protein